MTTTTTRTTTRNDDRDGRRFVRLTGLFKTQSGRGYSGRMRPEEVKLLVDLIKEARAEGRGLVFFVWRNEGGRGPAWSLTAAVTREAADSRRRVGTKPIRPPAAKPSWEEEDEDPFPAEGEDLEGLG